MLCHQLCKNSWTDRDGILDAESGGPKEPRGADAPMGRGTFVGVSRSLQSIGFRGLGKRVSCTKTGGPILTIYTSYDVLLHEEVPFGDHDMIAPHLIIIIIIIRFVKRQNVKRLPWR